MASSDLAIESRRRRALWLEVGTVCALCALPGLMTLVQVAVAGPSILPALHPMDALRAARSSVYPIARIAVILYILWRGGDLEILGSPKPAWLADISIAVGAIVVGSLIANLMLWMAALGGSPRPHYASSAAWSHSAPAAVVAGSMFNLLIAIASEVFYRGYLIRRLQTLFRSTFFAVAASCVLYSVVYLQYGVVGGIVPSVLGLILALVFLKTNRLWPVIFAHYFVLMYGWLR